MEGSDPLPLRGTKKIAMSIRKIGEYLRRQTPPEFIYAKSTRSEDLHLEHDSDCVFEVGTITIIVVFFVVGQSADEKNGEYEMYTSKNFVHGNWVEGGRHPPPGQIS